jgi:N-acetylglucosaminyldiphosphoundecaprenol N-acetyl-beta-D-mannosaminyltransferase
LKNPAFAHLSLLGVRVDILDQGALINNLISCVKDDQKKMISYVNAHALNIAYKEKDFRRIINSSGIIFCDGFGVKWAAKLVNRVDLARITPTDWFPVLAKECAEKGISMYFLGAKEGVAEKAANKLILTYPDLNILGSHHGYFDKTKFSEENAKVIKEINSLQPDILVVGFGMPAQEKWIHENWEELGIKVALPVGALFDYLAGEIYRVPRWMTENGLEWFGRLLIEPGRLWKRYILGNPLFIWRLFVHHVLGLKLPE